MVYHTLTAAIFTTIIMASMVVLTSTEIYTSSFKVQRMVNEEKKVLELMKSYIDRQQERLNLLSNFYTNRLRELDLREEFHLDPKHPNTVYNVIKEYASIYSRVLNEKIDRLCSNKGMFQTVYDMKASDMVKGDYLGFQGPQLEPADAYEIGKIAFSSEEEKKNEQIKETDENPKNGDLSKLDKELNETRPNYTSEPPDLTTVTVSKLCSLGSTSYPQVFYRVSNSRPLFCRYRTALLPYQRFQEEILSVTPFVSVMYHVISDQEAGHIKDRAGGKLKRGLISSKNETVSDIRTTNTAWIYDCDSAIVASISTRIAHITGLETAQRLPDGPSSAEPLQVANYGLGGHYGAHMDVLV
ncbi:unnamed protein product, partial [Candidula unifasciata]